MKVVLVSFFKVTLPVAQQPEDTYVAAYGATQFRRVEEWGAVGLLLESHPMLPALKVGDRVTTTDEEGESQAWSVVGREIVEALDPLNPFGEFAWDGRKFLSSELAREMYRSGGLTLQTCMGLNKRLFVICETCGVCH